MEKTRADNHPAAHGGLHDGAGRYALEEAAASRELTFGGEEVFCHELQPLGGPHWSSAFLKDCTSWRGPMLEQLVKDYPVGDILCWSRGKA